MEYPDFKKHLRALETASIIQTAIHPKKRDTYEDQLAAANVPADPADRTVDDCDRAWTILDQLDCPPIEEPLGDEPF